MIEALPPTIPPADASRIVGDYISSEGRFYHGRDKDVALGLADRLRVSREKDWCSPDEYVGSLASLLALVPVDAGDGKRSIAGKVVSKGQERFIRSRTESLEVDIADPDAGSWGSLPDVVKRGLTAHGQPLTIEMTSNCTVGCFFCGYANKGPVARIASFDSILAVCKEFFDMQAETYDRTHDVFYWGTDPFDAYWKETVATPARRYSDLVTEYAALASANGRTRGLFTSTAVPLGEELHVLECFIAKTIGHRTRVSQTNANQTRVLHMENVYGSLFSRFGGRKQSLGISKVKPVARGKIKMNPEDINPWEVLGPNGTDGIIIGLDEVDKVVVVGASEERPDGEIRDPIMRILENGKREYTIPHHFLVSSAVACSWEEIYPNTKLDQLVVNDDGTLESSSVAEITHNPHRSLARLAAMIMRFARSNPRWRGSIESYNEHMTPEIAVLEEHIRTTPNAAMSSMLHMAAVILAEPVKETMA